MHLVITGDHIPIRLYLASYRLTPTMRNVEDLFTVKYYLNLVLVDVDENRYFKQQVFISFIREKQVPHVLQFFIFILTTVKAYVAAE